MALHEHQAADESGTLGQDEVTAFVHAVGAAAASRVPLEVTLAVLAEEKDDPRLADVAHRLAGRLQQGATIEQAVAELEHELPAEVRGIAAGRHRVRRPGRHVRAVYSTADGVAAHCGGGSARQSPIR